MHRLVLSAVGAAMGIVIGLTQIAMAAPPDREIWKAKYQRPGSIPFPADNPFSLEKAQLGQMLFFDPRLSGTGNMSCATCHNPALAWGDGLPTGSGHRGTVLDRRSPTILNLAWAKLLMWDGRKRGLEDQVMGPVENPNEMNSTGDAVIARLQTIDGYKARFGAVFPQDGLTRESVVKALATFERTVISGPAPFDHWINGREDAIPESAKRGFDLFNGKAKCASCHSGWAFTNHGFADIGLPSQDIGRGAFSRIEEMQYAFKTPTLRDIALRGPYMHDGSVKTLAAVIRHYDTGFIKRPSLAQEITRLNLSDGEIDDLVAFMESLTGEALPVTIPILPPNPH